MTRIQCQGCGAELRGRSCDYCGRPHELASGAGELPCPRCQGAAHLVPRRLSGLELDDCAECGGLWVPAASFDAVLKSSGGTSKVAGRQRVEGGSTGDVRYVRCPACSQLMHRENFGRTSGVIVDRCPTHGVWLDQGELAALRGFVASGGLDRARKEQASEDRPSRPVSTPELTWSRTSGGSFGGGGLLDDLGRLFDLF